MTPKRLALGCAVALALAVPAATSAARARFGLEGGLNHARLSYRTGDPTQQADAPATTLRPAWSLGPLVEFDVGRSASLVAGARYLQFAERWRSSAQISGQTYSQEVRSTFHYVAVPLRVEAHPLGPEWPLSLGTEVGYLLRARRHTDLHGGVYGAKVRPMAQIYESAGAIPTDITGEYRRLNLSLAAGAGFAWRLGAFAVVTRGAWSQGVLDLLKSDAAVRRTRGLELTTGVRW